MDFRVEYIRKLVLPWSHLKWVSFFSLCSNFLPCRLLNSEIILRNCYNNWIIILIKSTSSEFFTTFKNCFKYFYASCALIPVKSLRFTTVCSFSTCFTGPPFSQHSLEYIPRLTQCLVNSGFTLEQSISRAPSVSHQPSHLNWVVHVQSLLSISVKVKILSISIHAEYNMAIIYNCHIIIIIDIILKRHIFKHPSSMSCVR